MYEVYCSLRDRYGVRDADVCRSTGIPSSTFADWKKGRSTPKLEKLEKIAAFFGVTVEYLRTGYAPDGGGYYIDSEARDLAQFLFEHPDHRVLFDLVKRVRYDDVDFMRELLDRLVR